VHLPPKLCLDSLLCHKRAGSDQPWRLTAWRRAVARARRGPPRVQCRNLLDAGVRPSEPDHSGRAALQSGYSRHAKQCDFNSRHLPYICAEGAERTISCPTNVPGRADGVIGAERCQDTPAHTSYFPAYRSRALHRLRRLADRERISTRPHYNGTSLVDRTPAFDGVDGVVSA